MYPMRVAYCERRQRYTYSASLCRFGWDWVKTLRPSQAPTGPASQTGHDAPGAPARASAVASWDSVSRYVRARDKTLKTLEGREGRSQFKFYIDTVNQKRATADITNERPIYSLIPGFSIIFFLPVRLDSNSRGLSEWPERIQTAWIPAALRAFSIQDP